MSVRRASGCFTLRVRVSCNAGRFSRDGRLLGSASHPRLCFRIKGLVIVVERSRSAHGATMTILASAVHRCALTLSYMCLSDTRPTMMPHRAPADVVARASTWPPLLFDSTQLDSTKTLSLRLVCAALLELEHPPKLTMRVCQAHIEASVRSSARTSSVDRHH